MKNKTHTHKGHCQVCGRIHAVDVTHNFIAKHGYTVDFGFFNGVCEGSGELPLEIDKSLTEETIVELTNYLALQSTYLEGLESGKVENLDYYWVTFQNSEEEGEEDKVIGISNSKKSFDRYINKYCSRFAYLDGVGFAKHCELRNKSRRLYRKSTEEMMQELIKDEIRATSFNIKQATLLKNQLEEMVSEVHGQPLINVADTDKILRELETIAKKDFYETNVVTVERYNHENHTTEQVKVRRYISFDNIAERETSIGTVAIKVSRPNLRKYKDKYYEKVTVHCLLNGKKIARAKLIEKLQ